MNRGTDFGYGHDDFFLMRLNRSVGGGFLGSGIVTVLTTTAAVVIMVRFLLARTAPDEKHRNPQKNQQRNKLLPVHADLLSLKNYDFLSLFKDIADLQLFKLSKSTVS